MNLRGNTVTGRVESAPDLRHVQIAVLAKAPVPGFAKTRLIPALGPAGAARLQRCLALRTVRTALVADLGPVTLWCAPDVQHRFFRALRRTSGIRCLAQPEGELGVRMHAAFVQQCSAGPVLLVGTDCPPMTPAHLRRAALALQEGADAVFHPAEDGGYVLVGLRRPQEALFSGMAWGTDRVMAATRARAGDLGIRMRELETLWDVDVVADLPRLQELLAGEDSTPGLERHRHRTTLELL
ncbi:MAG: TIGR04282 family arsenosugar biosynthesis glycosyltransferase [Rhodoferax sp.]|nr:TIGR04282 family arsenosugar biosynthesis glycosyltransferase [Rhodoferax sp.]